MSVHRQLLLCLYLFVAGAALSRAHAQTGFDLKIDKPAPYEDRQLRAEKTGEKPFKAPKRFFNNLTTHYNYFFNASNKLNEVIDGAKSSFKDDYTTLLPFYNYSLDATAQNTTQLDSVIYKSKTGIVMHDLRNDWIDNMYMLWGAAWFMEKKFDSAALMFQFINYSFAEKEKDGYYKYIGSRMDGNNALSIASAEKNKFPKNTVTPPSRNNALIWLTRSLIELGNMPEAGSLIATLKNDPLFPKRLNDDLEEVQAYWFYKQQLWDSSARHLLQALGQAKTKTEKARWEFLAAQMLQKAGQNEEAQDLYARSISHTTDPVMDVYARLNMVRINTSGGENYIDKNIADLLKMAKRDKYTEYRDIIYFMAAQMEMERNNYAAAQELLLKSAKYNNGNLSSRNKSYLLIADLSFDQKKYFQAASFYDSIQTKELKPEEAARVEDRKAALAKITALIGTINREDSLQRIAAMPEEERTVFVTRLVKRLRKQQGLSDAPPLSAGSAPIGSTPVDLFTNSQSKGEWYFYNNTLKTQGLQQFRQVWGTRPNVDNWRRFADVNQQLLTNLPTNTRDANKAADANIPIDNTPTFASLVANLPLTDAKLQASNDSLRNALFHLGMAYMSDVEDYPSAIETFEQLRTRFPGFPNMNEVLFNLYYAYKKAGNDAKAEEIKRSLLTAAPSSRYASIITTGKDPAATTDNKTSASTKAYEAVYDLFLEGKFDEAEKAKQEADSLYRTSYWQPQLLYIEAVYQVRQRNDSIAKNTLQTLIGQNPNSPLAAKAQTLIDVVNRRKQIEAELTAMQIERPAEDSIRQPQPAVQIPRAVIADTVSRPKNPVVINTQPKAVDSIVKKPADKAPVPATAYKYDPGARHYAVIVLDRVDPLFAAEVKNAFTRYHRERLPNESYQINVTTLNADKRLVLIGDFINAQAAIEYVKQAKQFAPGEILPWLKADKYSFSILSEWNLGVLSEKKDIGAYRQFLDQNLPVKF